MRYLQKDVRIFRRLFPRYITRPLTRNLVKLSSKLDSIPETLDAYQCWQGVVRSSLNTNPLVGIESILSNSPIERLQSPEIIRVEILYMAGLIWILVVEVASNWSSRPQRCHWDQGSDGLNVGLGNPDTSTCEPFSTIPEFRYSPSWAQKW